MADVLVADDDKPIRDALCILLEGEGYQVTEAESGAEALRIIRTHPRRLIVLLDNMMPKMTGLEVLRTIATDPAFNERHAYFLVTAARRVTRELHGLPSDFAVTVIHKPFDIQEIVTAVEAAAHRLAAGA